MPLTTLNMRRKLFSTIWLRQECMMTSFFIVEGGGSSLVPSPPPQLSSLAVRIMQRILLSPRPE